MFKKDFIFRKTSLVTTLHTHGQVIHGFLYLKFGGSSSLQQSGLLIEKHSDHEAQLQAYKQWQI
jgi:hypothetical protein